MRDGVKTVIGFALILAGIALGLYLGMWVMFVGGIVQAVNAIKATPVEALGIALGILRIVCAGLVGWLSALVLILPGKALL